MVDFVRQLGTSLTGKSHATTTTTTTTTFICTAPKITTKLIQVGDACTRANQAMGCTIKHSRISLAACLIRKFDNGFSTQAEKFTPRTPFPWVTKFEKQQQQMGQEWRSYFGQFCRLEKIRIFYCFESNIQLYCIFIILFAK